MTKLESILSELSQSSARAVQNGQVFSDLDKYLHVERPVSDELLTKMTEIDAAGGGIILLVGSAGDGKSHLLSKLKEGFGWSTSSFYNDATASYSPNKTAIDTLKHALVEFSDERLDTTQQKLVIAINLGKLNSFIEDEEAITTYGKIISAVKPIFEDTGKSKPTETKRIKIVQFTNKQIFELYPDRNSTDCMESNFLSQILERIVNPQPSNPFFVAFQKDASTEANLKKPIMLNYMLLQKKEVRDTIVKTVIEAIICYKLIITPREFLDFIYRILVAPIRDKYQERSDFYECLLPSLMYSGGNNIILRALAMLDPLKHSSTEHDNILSALFSSVKIPNEVMPQNITGELPEYLVRRTNLFYSNNGRDTERTIKFLLRLTHLMSYHSNNADYLSYIDILTGVCRGDSDYMMAIYDKAEKAITRHTGSYFQKDGRLPLNIKGGKYRQFADLTMVPKEPIVEYNQNMPNEFYPNLILEWEVTGGKFVKLVVDYSIYHYISELSNGRLAVSYENEKDLAFNTFVRELTTHVNCEKSIYVVKVGESEMKLFESFSRLCFQ